MLALSVIRSIFAAVPTAEPPHAVTLAVRPVLAVLIRSRMMRHKTEARTRSG
jgi:hypothetical protein